MENTILTWVADREYIPNTLCVNVREYEFIWLLWRLSETAPRPRFACPAGGTGRLYKIQLPEGKILGMWGESGHELGELNWAHGIACPSEDLIYIADMNDWRVQRLVTKGKK